MTLTALLADRGIDRALIIDDGYDPVPLAADLEGEDQAWAVFVADMGIDHDVIDGAYPGYRDVDTDELIRRDAFVAALWNLKGQLSGTSWEDLFGRYEVDVRGDREYLDRLEAALGALGIAVIRGARVVPVEGHDAPLVFIDLFLGGAQDAQAMDQSIERVRALIKDRETDPPLVILMSRSDRLDLSKEDFRDRAKVLGAMFRVCGKNDLLQDGVLPRLLTRLVQHQPDARKVATFLHAWELGLTQAKDTFLAKVRKLDLADYTQIRDLLLAFEGQPLGSYLLDVFDKVLQHEIESDADTIAAARALNEVDPAAYLAPHIAGSADLQELVYRTIYQHPGRLAVPATAAGQPVGFGDILVDRQLDPNADLAGRQVLMVMTPACDLVRNDCRQVMLMAGELKALTPSAWSYAGGSPRTPIITFPNDRRYWISWDLKNLRTWEPPVLAAGLGPEGDFTIHVRMREGPALELQQRMLADLGRVGQIAHMPATFALAVEIHRVMADGTWTLVALDILDRDGGVCFVGRDGEANNAARLVLSEAVCDEISGFIASVQPETVPERGRAALARLQTSTSFPVMLERGLVVSNAGDKFVAIKASRLDGEGKETAEPVCLVARNPRASPTAQQHRDCAIAIVLKDFATVEAPAPAAPAVGGDVIAVAAEV